MLVADGELDKILIIGVGGMRERGNGGQKLVLRMKKLREQDVVALRSAIVSKEMTSLERSLKQSVYDALFKNMRVFEVQILMGWVRV